MWTCIANKFTKFHVKRLNQSENIPTSFRGYSFKTPCTVVLPLLGLSLVRMFYLSTLFMLDNTNQSLTPIITEKLHTVYLKLYKPKL